MNFNEARKLRKKNGEKFGARFGKKIRKIWEPLFCNFSDQPQIRCALGFYELGFAISPILDNQFDLPNENPLKSSEAFLLGSFLLTAELFDLQLTTLAFLLTIRAFLLTILAILLQCESASNKGLKGL